MAPRSRSRQRRPISWPPTPMGSPTSSCETVRARPRVA
jgi:hypothetical protein